jgi:hypothetical protein
MEDRVFRVGHDVTVGLAALGDAVHDLVQPDSQLGVLLPAQGIAHTH